MGAQEAQASPGGLLFVFLCLLAAVGASSVQAKQTPKLTLDYTLRRLDVVKKKTTLPSPVEVYSNQGKLQVSLTVAPSQFTVGGQASTFCLDANDATICSVPGPSLFVKPGDEVNITIVSSSTPNVTFALHGTPSLGVKHSGGNSFVFTVPSDASPGTHWYRSPLSLQILAGLHGALVVRPHDDNALSPAFVALTRRMCVFSHVMTGRNPPDGFFVWSAKPGKYEQSLTGVGSSTDVWLTNGVYQPVLVATSSVTILDVVVASGDRLLELEMRSAVGYGAGTRQCSIGILALDGLILPDAPRDTTHLVLFPGARASLAISCPNGTTNYLQTVSTTDFTSIYAGVGSASTKSAQLLLELRTSLSAAAAATSSSSSSSVLSSLLSLAPTWISPRSSSTSTSLHLSTVQQGAGAGGGGKRWLGAGTDCTLPCFTMADCVALFGVGFNASTAFPSARFGKCKYSSWAEVILEAAEKDEEIELTLWGWLDDIVPLHFSVPVRLVSFTPAASVYPGGLDYVEPAADLAAPGGIRTLQYSPPPPDRPSLYGKPGDWRDVHPSLPGKTVLRVRLPLPSGGLFTIAGGQATDLADGMLLTVKVISASKGAADGAETPSVSKPTTSETHTPRKATISTGTLLSPTSYSSSYTSVMSVDSPPLTLSCSPDGSSWGYSETADEDLGVRTLSINGCPNHVSTCQAQECGGSSSTLAFLHPKTVTLPLYPRLAPASAGPRDTTCTTDPVGFAINGVGIYGPAADLTSSSSSASAQNPSCETPGSLQEILGLTTSITAAGRTTCDLDKGKGQGLLYCGDFLQDNAALIDACGGSSDALGRYGYRVAPQCLLEQTLQNQVGWALDGFPIFGPRDDVLPCGSEGAHSEICLDACGGYKGPLPTDQFLYRYFLAGDVGLGGGGGGGDGGGAGVCNSQVSRGDQIIDCQRDTDKCCVASVPPQRPPYSISCLVGCLVGESCSDEPGTRTTYQPLVLGIGAEGLKLWEKKEKKSEPSSSAATDTSSSSSTISSSNSSSEPLAELYRQQLQRRNKLNTAQLNKTTTTVNPSVTEAAPPAVLVQSIDGDLELSGGAALPSGSNDAILFGLALSSSSSTLFYSSLGGVFSVSFSSSSSSPTILVAGLLLIDIYGFNFGRSIGDVDKVTARGAPCASIVWASSKHLRCFMTQPGFLVGSGGEGGLMPSEVYVAVRGGDAHGPYPVPETLLTSRSDRPIIASVSFNSVPLRPLALSLGGEDEELYFSSWQGGIYRVFQDGAQIEQLLLASSRFTRIFGLAVVASGSGGGKVVLFSHEGGVSGLVVPPMQRGLVYVEENGAIPVVTGLQSPGSLLVDVKEQRLFVTDDFVVLRVELPAVLSLFKPATASAAVSALPTPSLILSTSTSSRLGGLTLLPAVSGVNEWEQQRLLAIDSNRNLLHALTGWGGNGGGSDVELFMERADSDAVLWPTAVTAAASSSVTRNVTIVHVYVAELLGKVWQLTLTLDKQTKKAWALLDKPVLLLDKSLFPASAALRQIATAAKELGRPSGSAVFVDIL